MPATTSELTTPDGTVAVYVTHPEGTGPWPGVVMFPDAFGPRPTSRAMADRLSAHGYGVLVPDTLYRSRPYEPFDPATVFGGSAPAELQRLMHVLEATTDELAMRDTAVYIDHLRSLPQIRGPHVAVMGYCLGGGLALRAGCAHAGSIAAVLSIHGGRFVTEPGAAAEIAASLRAPAYVAVAEIDRRHDAATSARLEAAFRDAGVEHAVELYAGAAHGFTVPDLPPYDRDAAERHWVRVVDFLGRAFT
ncbi:MAG: dienelactone hydrolase family protein [Deltaproteobacteria bacterium]|nr:dienelactone hydrolase family protein [Deltaproteobacteria bacterium]